MCFLDQPVWDIIGLRAHTRELTPCCCRLVISVVIRWAFCIVCPLSFLSCPGSLQFAVGVDRDCPYPINSPLEYLLLPTLKISSSRLSSSMS